MAETAYVPAIEVPFLDLGPSHEPVRHAILEDVAELIAGGVFVNGPIVAEFEERFAAYCGSSECVGVASGLDALRLALLAVGLEPGDEVVVPAMTFVATWEAVTQAGGRPVAADVSDDDCNLSFELAAAAITGRTRVLLPVHLYGQLADARGLRSVASDRGLAIVEDACQAHGAIRDGFRAGGVGLAAAFSFYPGKNLGAMGDAGALVTNDPELAAVVRALREHGQRAKYDHEFEGYTARLDAIQAIVLLRKLELLEGWNEERRQVAAFYGRELDGLAGLRLPHVPAGSEPVWHLYVVRTSEAEELAAFLRARGIATGRHYPTPPHLTSAYARLGYGRGDFPVAEAIAAEALSLPIFPGISPAQLEAVVVAIRAFFDA